MNYFELFGLPESIRVDQKILKERFFDLSRKNHPDYFVNEDADSQSRSLETTAELDKGFRVLSNQDDTIRYVLAIKGLLEDEEKSTLPQAFLMEMLEVNEEIADADLSDENEKQKLQQKLQSLNQEIYEPVAKIVENDQGHLQEEELLRLKEYYLKKKYLKRLAGQLGNSLPRH